MESVTLQNLRLVMPPYDFYSKVMITRNDTVTSLDFTFSRKWDVWVTSSRSGGSVAQTINFNIKVSLPRYEFDMYNYSVLSGIYQHSLMQSIVNLYENYLTTSVNNDPLVNRQRRAR